MPVGKLLFQKAESALIEEKAIKLFGITRILDDYLTQDFKAILQLAGVSDVCERESKVRILQEALLPFADQIARAFPGVGVGYFASCVDSIVAYAPSEELGGKVGLSLWPDHIGRQAMREGREMVGVGSMVRGDIMNCVRPLVRYGETIGFVWANETVEDIYRQLARGGHRLFLDQNNVQPLLGLTGILILATRFLVQVDDLAPGYDVARQGAIRVTNEFNRELERMRHYLVMFLNSLDVGVLVQSYRGHMVFLNKQLKKLLGELGRLTEEIDEKVFDELGLRGVPQVIDWMERKKVWNLNFHARFTGVHGKPGKEVNLVVALIPGSEPGKNHRIYFFEDLVRVRAEEQERWRAQKLAAAGEVAAMVAHEIRNPLAVIKGAINLLPEKLGDQEFLQGLARVVSQEIERVNNTLEALLAFTRTNEPEFRRISLIQVLRETVELVRGYAEDSNVKLSQEYQELPIIQGDHQHLRQAFLNLLVNAIQAMPEGGLLKVQAYTRQGSNLVEVRIEDTGSGIAIEDQPHIFEMFFTRKQGGTGLGLALVQRIIDEHQGFIKVDSIKGQGTTFTITLPVRRYNAPEVSDFGGKEGWA